MDRQIFAAPAAITPERDVVISDTSKEPGWKLLWDEARELTRQEKYVVTISPLSAVSDRQAAGAIQSLYATYGGNGCHPVGVK